MVHHLALVGKARGAIGHQALALGQADFLAQVGFGIQAIFAFAAFRRVKRNDMVALGERGHTLANLHHDARALMAHDGRKQAFGIGAGNGEFIGVADAGCLDFNQNLAFLRACQVNLNNFQGLCLLQRQWRRVISWVPISMKLFFSYGSLVTGLVKYNVVKMGWIGSRK